MDEKIEYVEDVDDKIGATNLVLIHRTIFKTEENCVLEKNKQVKTRDNSAIYAIKEAKE